MLDPNETEELEQSLTEGLEKEDQPPAPVAADPANSVDPAKPEPVEPAPIEQKRRSTDKPDFDPEEEFGQDEEGNPIKMKRSDLRKTAEWMAKNKNMVSGAMRIRQLATENPEFRKLFETVVQKSFEGDKYNAEFVAKTLKSFEAATEKVDKDIDDQAAEIKEAEAALEDLDSDSPQAKALSKSISYMKRQMKELSSTKKNLDALSTRLDGIENSNKEATRKFNEAEQSVEVKRLSDIFAKEIGALTDKEKKDGYKFIDEDEESEFGWMVRNLVASQSGKIKTDDDFIRITRETAKAVYEKMSKRRESTVNDYLRKKGQSPPGETPKNPEEPKPLGNLSEEEVVDLVTKGLEDSMAAEKKS